MRKHKGVAHRGVDDVHAGLARRTMRGCLRGSVLLLMLLVGALTFGWWRALPQALPVGSESERRVVAGPYWVETAEFEWVDASRKTAANGDFEGAPQRRFDVTIWYPRDSSAPHPLVVYVHGFVAVRTGGAYLAEHLASYGYVVVAADHPLTRLGAPGGPDFDDVVNQPGDVSFLIDQMLALRDASKPFPGELDEGRIGVMGLSLGGLTATLAGFHPELRDGRLSAAISIAGPADIFAPSFFEHAELPLLMIGGTADAMMEYQRNAAVIPDLLTRGGLVALEGATHLGFDQVATTWLRPFSNPDTVACRLASMVGQATAEEHPFSGKLGTLEQGFLLVDEVATPCDLQVSQPMKSIRQQLLTRTIVRAFLDSHFAQDPLQRDEHAAFFQTTLPQEVPEVRFTPARRAKVDASPVVAVGSTKTQGEGGEVHE